jgi:hypothetical protein
MKQLAEAKIMDVTYTPSISVVELPVTNPIHKPCPDMAGCCDLDPQKTKRSLTRVSDLRKQLAEKLPKKPKTVIPERFRQASFGRA